MLPPTWHGPRIFTRSISRTYYIPINHQVKLETYNAPSTAPIHRPPETLGIVSSSDSRQGKFTPGPLRLNHSSLSGTIELRHQGTSMASTHLMLTSLPPETPRRPPSHMERQVQSRIPWPSAQVMRRVLSDRDIITFLLSLCLLFGPFPVYIYRTVCLYTSTRLFPPSSAR